VLKRLEEGVEKETPKQLETRYLKRVKESMEAFNALEAKAKQIRESNNGSKTADGSDLVFLNELLKVQNGLVSESAQRKFERRLNSKSPLTANFGEELAAELNFHKLGAVLAKNKRQEVAVLKEEAKQFGFSSPISPRTNFSIKFSAPSTRCSFRKTQHSSNFTKTDANFMKP